jgi:hypothetical protein
LAAASGAIVQHKLDDISWLTKGVGPYILPAEVAVASSARVRQARELLSSVLAEGGVLSFPSGGLAAEERCGYSSPMRGVGRSMRALNDRELTLQRRDWARWMPDWQAVGLSMVVGFALVIRVYLSLASYCISGDGVAYLAMARHFADGDWRAALGAVYSPLYPALVSLMHRWVTNWELAGNVVSTILGTGAVATTYLMTREAFGSSELGLGAAILMALHPETAGYSASVRTEAGYLFLTTSACWLLLKTLKDRQLVFAACGGLVAGLAYLYRTEAIGFLPLGVVLFLAAGWSGEQASRRWALGAASAFAALFIVVAAPYVAYLRIATGHWTVGREFTAAMMYGIGDVAGNGGDWRQLGWAANASPLTAIFDHPWLYANKVAQCFVVSAYNFAQALEPLLTLMLAIGIWRELFGRPPTILKFDGRAGGSEKAERGPLPEIFLAAIVLFYFCGFSFSYTGTRFMVHLIPFVFGWVALGIIAVTDQAAQWCGPGSRRIVFALIPAAIVITLLPRTLWPNGYDMRGLRYAGEDIARRVHGPAVVVARDGRVAYYAGARLIELPPSPPDDLCGWLDSQRGDFLMIGENDERLFNVADNLSCLELLKRYPRYGAGYFDLYAVRLPEQDGHSPSVSRIGPG